MKYDDLKTAAMAIVEPHGICVIVRPCVGAGVACNFAGLSPDDAIGMLGLASGGMANITGQAAKEIAMQAGCTPNDVLDRVERIAIRMMKQAETQIIYKRPTP